MKHVIKWLDEYLEASLGALLLAIIVGLIALQVFMRYVLGNALSWSEELTLWAFIWFIWVGIAYAFKERRHVRVTVFQGFLPEKAANILETVIDVVIIIFLLTITYHSYQLISLPYVASQKSVVLSLPIPMLYASAPFGALLSAFRISQNLISKIKNTNSPIERES
ncbi:MAG: TRAP transporter small permease [Psychromonas sp.]